VNEARKNLIFGWAQLSIIHHHFFKILSAESSYILANLTL